MGGIVLEVGQGGPGPNQWLKVSEDKEWIESLVAGVEEVLKPARSDESVLKVCAGYRLPYAVHVLRYTAQDVRTLDATRYETDLLVFDEYPNEDWVPRTVIACHRGAVRSREALAYRARAAAHKQVHPYLRYGILIGGGGTLPMRLIRHGEPFDFLAVLEDLQPSLGEWVDLGQVLCQEVRTSRQLQTLLVDADEDRTAYRLLHRPLLLGRPEGERKS